MQSHLLDHTYGIPLYYSCPEIPPLDGNPCISSASILKLRSVHTALELSTEPIQWRLPCQLMYLYRWFSIHLQSDCNCLVGSVLRMKCCWLSELSCDSLRSNPSRVRVVDLSHKELQDSVVMLFCDLLLNPLCELETLRSVLRVATVCLFVGGEKEPGLFLWLETKTMIFPPLT